MACPRVVALIERRCGPLVFGMLCVLLWLDPLREISCGFSAGKPTVWMSYTLFLHFPTCFVTSSLLS
ncbi:hypothetical protein K491DRAFT_697810 [Lophiostoma macrostomum CBS 122681]|uniref:Uncharacterized protein n=1 Tax=Lophiostoma macrostomum CBS 122681 TaxID=1314788 RepID=A0A6A6SUB9_9PLEO|nr:hypothetical protein K491DRAFT_697810 [Lophiostoma macrostomum CBS 122681]